MSTVNKILLVIFSILIIFAVIEIGYFFIYKPSRNPPAQQITPTKAVSNKKELPDSIAKIIAQGKYPKYSLNPALDQGAINSFRFISKNMFISSTVNLSLKGAINQINTEGGEYSLPINGAKIKFLNKIVFGAKDGFYSLYLFNQEDLAKVTFVKSVDNKEEPIKISDLKVGDWIYVNITMDLSKDISKNLIKAKVIKKQ